MRGVGTRVALVGCLLPVVAGAGATIFQRISGGRAATSPNVIARIDRIAAELASVRRDLEMQNTCRARIARAEQAPLDLEAVQCRLSEQPTSTHLDRWNRTVHVRLMLPWCCCLSAGEARKPTRSS